MNKTKVKHSNRIWEVEYVDPFSGVAELSTIINGEEVLTFTSWILITKRGNILNNHGMNPYPDHVYRRSSYVDQEVINTKQNGV